MPNPMDPGAFPAVLDPLFQELFQNQHEQEPDMLPTLYTSLPHNGREDMKWSEIGALGDWDPFEGNVVYDSMSEGYDTTMTFLEFTKGIQVRRRLFDDDQHNIFTQKPVQMAESLVRTRQKHGARPFELGFSNDPMFYQRSEGVPIFSTGHTTRSPGVSTATGFSNYSTSSLSAVAVKAGRVQMRSFRDDRANRINTEPDELWIPTDLYEIAEEINTSQQKLDGTLNNTNVQKGKWNIHEWVYLDNSPRNWFMASSKLRKRWVVWVDRIEKEFAMVEDFDTYVGKWRGYARYAFAVLDWRWGLGFQVA